MRLPDISDGQAVLLQGINEQSGRLRPKLGYLFRVLVYEKVVILLAEVYERAGKSLIWVCERAYRG